MILKSHWLEYKILVYVHYEGRFFFCVCVWKYSHTDTHTQVLDDGINFISYYESQLKQFKSYCFRTGGQQMLVLWNKIHWNVAYPLMHVLSLAAVTPQWQSWEVVTHRMASKAWNIYYSTLHRKTCWTLQSKILRGKFLIQIKLPLYIISRISLFSVCPPLTKLVFTYRFMYRHI